MLVNLNNQFQLDLSRKCSAWKDFRKEFLSPTKVLGPKNFLAQNILAQKRILDPKKMLGLEKFVSKRNFESQNILV